MVAARMVAARVWAVPVWAVPAWTVPLGARAGSQQVLVWRALPAWSGGPWAFALLAVQESVWGWVLQERKARPWAVAPS